MQQHGRARRPGPRRGSARAARRPRRRRCRRSAARTGSRAGPRIDRRGCAESSSWTFRGDGGAVNNAVSDSRSALRRHGERQPLVVAQQAPRLERRDDIGGREASWCRRRHGSAASSVANSVAICSRRKARPSVRRSATTSWNGARRRDTMATDSMASNSVAALAHDGGDALGQRVARGRRRWAAGGGRRPAAGRWPPTTGRRHRRSSGTAIAPTRPIGRRSPPWTGRGCPRCRARSSARTTASRLRSRRRRRPVGRGAAADGARSRHVRAP